MRLVITTFLQCVLIGLAFGTFLYFTYDPRPVRIFINIVSSVCIGSLMCFVVYQRRYFTFFTQHLVLRMIIIILLLVASALVGQELAFILRATIVGDMAYKFANGGNVYALDILIALVVGIPMYVHEEGKSSLNNRITQQQFRLLQLEQQKTAFELELLRAKINPHFLYNVHNTIAGLISIDPAKAEQLVLLLSKFFRFSLNNNSSTFHEVATEIDIISTYLAMQKFRFDNRLTYHIAVDPNLQHQQVPSFILQPLVENAIKHGIEPNAGPGTIEVKVQAENGQIVMIIADNGPHFPVVPNGGMGLHMVMNKLQLLYSNNFSFELSNEPFKHVRISVAQQHHHDYRG
ncbi:histidine kinase [Chitinophaga skermanii]|uniref:Histidine kinase n=1 Tax=Chitinophaga skermanii TaxID=331697 RepID=A0A327R4N8_9BACT|nr:histidine kinase [Chitinophaga skermanii]RAJ10693.1 histidine kinase [Chitinophaga skermanii]